jgi:hypothetical protein
LTGGWVAHGKISHGVEELSLVAIGNGTVVDMPMAVTNGRDARPQLSQRDGRESGSLILEVHLAGKLRAFGLSYERPLSPRLSRTIVHGGNGRTGSFFPSSNDAHCATPTT